ncbi:MAG: molybdopterin molybdenumtransferase MoeA [Flavobacterium sp.]|nr:MAG: molybdopterin molybdenumtransferase MoeA [Flavobacterium sp.]
MISVNEAKKIIDTSVTYNRITTLPLAEAYGLSLAKKVIAAVDIPNFDQSSMDGYAIKFKDRNLPLSIIGEMAAGATAQLSIGDGEATRIFTGGPLPYNADTVVMQEKIRLEGDTLIILDNSLSEGLYVRPKGAEVKEGEIAMAEGTHLSAAALGFLAGIGCTEIAVYAPPSVGIILTGNELQEPGQPLNFGQVYEANSVQLTAALQKTGCRNIKMYRAEDNPEKLSEVLKKAMSENDVVLLNGGVSVGDYDFVVSAAANCGVEQKFHKIKQRPGKPLYFGVTETKMIFGLPGNPSSSLTCFYEYVLPALEKAMHLSPSLNEIKAEVTHNYNRPPGLTHFLKASYSNGKVTPLHAQESFRLHSFAQANCFIVLPEESTGCSAGDTVKVHLLPL